jgi:hypothetical protein
MELTCCPSGAKNFTVAPILLENLWTSVLTLCYPLKMLLVIFLFLKLLLCAFCHQHYECIATLQVWLKSYVCMNKWQDLCISNINVFYIYIPIPTRLFEVVDMKF